MADEKDIEKQTDLEQERSGEETEETAKSKASPVPVLTWIILAAAVAVSTGAGFALGRLFAASRKPAATESSQQDELAQTDEPRPDHSTTRSEKVWFYDLEPVVANLDVPGVTRYVRATLTLSISSQVDQKQGTALLEKKKRLLTNWLTIYLASLTLEDTRGDRNLRRIQSQILDAFNEKLFPDAKPQVETILFKEFAVQ
ncbi:MAG: flagellar basal body-associated FliL family protein [Planctomycetota bacterium]|jgi:flagellar basal body-associated protein FliL